MIVFFFFKFWLEDERKFHWAWSHEIYNKQSQINKVSETGRGSKNPRSHEECVV